jgi:hypothetical protein
MKLNEDCENVYGMGLKRVLVTFELASAAAIPIRNASGSNAACHASHFMPYRLVRPSRPDDGSPPTTEPTSSPSGVNMGMTPGDFVA